MSDLTPRPVPVPLEQTRQRVIEQLCEHYAVENLTDEALEDRLNRAYAATDLVTLQALVADLPVQTPGAPAASGSVAVARAGTVSDHQVIFAVMAGTERKGAWTPPRSLNVIAVMGGAHLDFRQAAFGPGVTEVSIFAMMGGVEIVVPPGVQVEMNGFAFMGGFVQKGESHGPEAPDAPILRIGGVAFMGGVEVQVRYPGERESDARARERLARREARQELKQLRRGRD